MRIGLLLWVAALATFAGSITPAAAQTTTATLDDCRAKAIGQGLSGEARNKAISDCFGQPVSTQTSAASGRYDACRTDARTRGLRGDAFGEALDQCMAQSGAPSDGSAKYADCRSRAIARGLAGEARGEFVDSCLSD